MATPRTVSHSLFSVWLGVPFEQISKLELALAADASATTRAETSPTTARGNTPEPVLGSARGRTRGDVLNRLLTVSGSPGLTLAGACPRVGQRPNPGDPAGRLYSTTSGGTVTRFQYDGDQLVAEYNSAGALLRRYVPGPAGSDDPVVWHEGSGTADRRWLLTDERGSVIGWADGSDNLIAAQAYGAYGEPQTWTGSRYAYTGQLGLCASIVAGVDASPVLEAAEHVLDLVALSVEGLVVRDRYPVISGEPAHRAEPLRDHDRGDRAVRLADRVEAKRLHLTFAGHVRRGKPLGLDAPSVDLRGE